MTHEVHTTLRGPVGKLFLAGSMSAPETRDSHVIPLALRLTRAEPADRP